MMRAGRRDAVDLWGPLARIPCPTLVVRGAESDILSPEIAKKMTEACPTGAWSRFPARVTPCPATGRTTSSRHVRAFLERATGLTLGYRRGACGRPPPASVCIARVSWSE